jgi:hypothetical protein
LSLSLRPFIALFCTCGGILFEHIYDLGVATLLHNLVAFTASIPIFSTASSASPAVTHKELPQGVPTSFMPQRSAG